MMSGTFRWLVGFFIPQGDDSNDERCTVLAMVCFHVGGWWIVSNDFGSDPNPFRTRLAAVVVVAQ